MKNNEKELLKHLCFFATVYIAKICTKIITISVCKISNVNWHRIKWKDQKYSIYVTNWKQIRKILIIDHKSLYLMFREIFGFNDNDLIGNRPNKKWWKYLYFQNCKLLWLLYSLHSCMNHIFALFISHSSITLVFEYAQFSKHTRRWR